MRRCRDTRGRERPILGHRGDGNRRIGTLVREANATRALGAAFLGKKCAAFLFFFHVLPRVTLSHVTLWAACPVVGASPGLLVIRPLLHTRPRGAAAAYAGWCLGSRAGEGQGVPGAPSDPFQQRGRGHYEGVDPKVAQGHQEGRLWHAQAHAPCPSVGLSNP